MNNNQFNINVGCKEIQIRDENKDITFNVLVQYPTHESSAPTAFGPYTMDVCINAMFLEGVFPLEREKFHVQLPIEILAYLNEKLYFYFKRVFIY